jgi:hypothetical protein
MTTLEIIFFCLAGFVIFFALVLWLLDLFYELKQFIKKSKYKIIEENE